MCLERAAGLADGYSSADAPGKGLMKRVAFYCQLAQPPQVAKANRKLLHEHHSATQIQV
jgi:hypothetical protein